MDSTHDRLDVLYLTHNYPRHSEDFSGRFVARLVRLLSDRGQRIGVLAPHHPGSAEHEQMDGVPVWRFRYASDDNEQIAYRGDWRGTTVIGSRGLFAHYRFMRSFIGAARALIKTTRPRLIHAHWWVPAGWVAQRFAPAVPMILTMHGTDLRLLHSKPWARIPGRRVLRRARIITTVSHWLADSVRAVDQRLDSKLRVIPMPVHDDVFGSAGALSESNRPPVILTVTRFTEQKRNHILIPALAKIKDNARDFHLRIIGEGGDQRARVERLVSQHELAQVTEFVGPLTAEQLAKEYRHAFVTVLPSVDEGFGMTLVEAQLCGCAVVGVQSGGIPDIIDNQVTGLMARPDDPDDLARAIQRLMDDRTLRNRMAAAGRESALRRFSSDVVAGKFLDWYREFHAP